MAEETKMVSVPVDVLRSIADQFLNLNRCKGLLNTLHMLSDNEIMDSSDAAADNLEEIRMSSARMLYNIIDDGVDPLLPIISDLMDKAGGMPEGGEQ